MKLNNRDKLVTWFCQNYPDNVQSMKDVSHFQKGRVNHPFHGEGEVWTHTMMVMTHLHCDTTLSPQDKQILLTVGMLHDIGKPGSIQIKDDPKIGTKYSFEGHEGLSTIMAIDILFSMEKEDDFYTNDIRKLILELISLHGTSSLCDESSYKFQLQKRFREADKGGAIRDVDEDIFNQYPKRKVSNRNRAQEDKSLIILIGMPGSGKTVYIRNNIDNKYFKISRDDEMERFYFKYNMLDQGSEPLTHNYIYTWINQNKIRLFMFNSYFEECLNKASREQDHVIIDMTMLTAGKRRKILNVYSKFTAHAVCFLKGEISMNDVNYNRISLGRTIVDEQINRLKKKFMMPVKEEGFETLEIILLDDVVNKDFDYEKNRRNTIE